MISSVRWTRFSHLRACSRLATLTFLEIILGVDNVIFISILSGKLPPISAAARAADRPARRDGHADRAADVDCLDRPPDGAARSPCSAQEISGRDLILHRRRTVPASARRRSRSTSGSKARKRHGSARVAPSFAAVIAQIMLLDIVFSLDSVITAVGMADDVVDHGRRRSCCRSAIMMFSAEPISEFVSRHPTVKVLALSFLLLIGVSLVGDGLGMHIPKGYIYFAMGFSVFVEMINLRVRGTRVTGAAAPAIRRGGTSRALHIQKVTQNG